MSFVLGFLYSNYTLTYPLSLIHYLILCLFFFFVFSLVRVLKALTRKFKLHDDVSLNSVAERCPPNFTGADMYALCADAWFHAAKRQVRPISGELFLVANGNIYSLNNYHFFS